MKKTTLLLLFLMNAIWGGTYAAVKSIMPHAPYYLVTSTRYLLAAIPVLLYVGRRYGLRMSRGDYLRCLIIGLSTLVFSPLLMYTGVNLGRSADAAILTATEPLLVALGAYFYLRERIGGRTVAALFIAFAGALLLSEFWRENGLVNPVAIALIATAVIFESTYSVLSKELLARHEPIKILAVVLLSGSLVNATAITGLGWWPDLAGLNGVDWLVLVVYLVLICTVFGFAFWNFALRHNATANVSLTIFVQPLFGLLIGWVWLRESPSFGQLTGTLMILAALTIAFSGQAAGPDRELPPAPPSV